MITITKVDGMKEIIPYGDENRCDNCGKPVSEAKHIITGGFLVEDEWACCHECYDEMIKKGCCFAELGDGVYRQQKY
jgi:hypothetical protein